MKGLIRHLLRKCHLPLKGKAKRDTIGYSVEKGFPFRGSWHGEAVTDEAVSRRGELEKGMIFENF